MAEETKTYVFGNDANNGGMVPAWLAYGNNGGIGNFGGGWGTGILGFLLGALIGNNGLFGNGWGGNSSAAAASLGAQATANNNTDLIMNAINGTDADVRLLATTLNADVNEVKSAINTVQSAIQNVSSQVGMSGLQVINSIQSGNAALASQLCQCCCENRLLTTQQGYEAQIRTLEQTNTLGAQADRNANNIIGAINAQTVAMNDQFCAARERDMQAKIDTQADIITQLRGQIDNANQTAAITGYVNSLIAPLQAKVTEIADKQLPTVPVQWPQIQAVNTTPYMGGMYGNGWNNGIYF
jgi:uncharacterized protein YoxC